MTSQGILDGDINYDEFKRNVEMWGNLEDDEKETKDIVGKE